MVQAGPMEVREKLIRGAEASTTNEGHSAGFKKAIVSVLLIA